MGRSLSPRRRCRLEDVPFLECPVPASPTTLRPLPPTYIRARARAHTRAHTGP